MGSRACAASSSITTEPTGLYHYDCSIRRYYRRSSLAKPAGFPILGVEHYTRRRRTASQRRLSVREAGSSPHRRLSGLYFDTPAVTATIVMELCYVGLRPCARASAWTR